jgi:hypothetical protein
MKELKNSSSQDMIHYHMLLIALNQDQHSNKNQLDSHQLEDNRLIKVMINLVFIKNLDTYKL